MYMSVVAQAFDLRQILISMLRINWEVKDVMSQHNSYIDIILRVSKNLMRDCRRRNVIFKFPIRKYKSSLYVWRRCLPKSQFCKKFTGTCGRTLHILLHILSSKGKSKVHFYFNVPGKKDF